MSLVEILYSYDDITIPGEGLQKCCKWGNHSVGSIFAMFADRDFPAKLKQQLSFCKCNTIRFEQSYNFNLAKIKPRPKLDLYKKPRTFSTAKLKPFTVYSKSRLNLKFTVSVVIMRHRFWRSHPNSGQVVRRTYSILLKESEKIWYTSIAYKS
jgi:hypothetical protein